MKFADIRIVKAMVVQKRALILNFLSCFLILIIPLVSHAEGTDESSNAQNQKYKLSIPDSPGLAVLGVASTPGASPGNARDFAAQVAFVTSEDGKLLTGLAVDTTPYWWFKNLSLHEYREASVASRIFARSQLSLATVPDKAADSEDIFLGAGLQFHLLDANDPRMDDLYTTCLARFTDKEDSRVATRRSLAQIQILTEAGPFQSDTLEVPSSFGSAEIVENYEKFENEVEKRMAALEDSSARQLYLKGIAQCEAERSKKSLGKPAWTLGVGGKYRATEGEYERLAYEGASVWTAFRLPAELFVSKDKKDGMGLFQTEFSARFSLDDVVQIPGGASEKADVIEAALSIGKEGQEFYLGGNTGRKWKLVGGASFKKKQFENSLLDDDEFFEYSAAMSIEIGPDIWLEFSTSATDGSDVEEERSTSINFKYDLAALKGR